MKIIINADGSGAIKDESETSTFLENKTKLGVGSHDVDFGDYYVDHSVLYYVDDTPVLIIKARKTIDGYRFEWNIGDDTIYSVHFMDIDVGSLVRKMIAGINYIAAILR